MITPVNQTRQQAIDEREALEQSERQAIKSRPGSFNDVVLNDKVVHVPSLENCETPIKGLDS